MHHTPYPPRKAWPLISGVAAAAALFGCLAPRAKDVDAAATTPRALVVFDHPERFDDIRIFRYADAVELEKDRAYVLKTFRDFVSSRAAAYLPEGESFNIRFTNIRLAGEFRQGGVRDTRIVTRNFPPEFVFSWSVIGPSGDVLRSGSEDILDGSFMDTHGSPDDIDRYFFDKAVLDDWMRAHLKSR